VVLGNNGSISRGRTVRAVFTIRGTNSSSAASTKSGWGRTLSPKKIDSSVPKLPSFEQETRPPSRVIVDHRTTAKSA
jgi:hypothetical protein